MPPIKIIDTIYHKNKYDTQVFHVVDRRPEFLYERKANWLIAEDSGFFNFYFYEKPFAEFKAFAGREFMIPMRDGSMVKANGQWWYGIEPSYLELLNHVAIGTPEKLGKCNVFTGLWIDPNLIRITVNPSNNYNKYDARSPDFGLHIIKSRWG